MKKRIILLLCLALCLGLFATAAFAEEEPASGEPESFSLRLVIAYTDDYAGEEVGGIIVYNEEDGTVTEYTEDTVLEIPAGGRLLYTSIDVGDTVLKINAPVDFDLVAGRPSNHTGGETIDGVSYTTIAADSGMDTIMLICGDYSRRISNTLVQFTTVYPEGYEGEDVGGVAFVYEEQDVTPFRAIGSGSTECPVWYSTCALEAIPLEGLVGEVSIGEGEHEIVVTYTAADQADAPGEAVPSGLILSDVTGSENIVLRSESKTAAEESEQSVEQVASEEPSGEVTVEQKTEETAPAANGQNLLLIALIAAAVAVMIASVAVIVVVKKKK